MRNRYWLPGIPVPGIPFSGHKPERDKQDPQRRKTLKFIIHNLTPFFAAFLNVINKSKYAGEKLTSIYLIHSHGYNVPPSEPEDYDAIKTARAKTAEITYTVPVVVGVVAAPKKIYLHDEYKVIAIVEYPMK